MNFRAVLLRLVLLNLLFGALVSCQQEPKTSVVNGVEVVATQTPDRAPPSLPAPTDTVRPIDAAATVSRPTATATTFQTSTPKSTATAIPATPTQELIDTTGTTDTELMPDCSDLPADYLTYSNGEQGVAFCYPSDWVVDDVFDISGLIAVSKTGFAMEKAAPNTLVLIYPHETVANFVDNPISSEDALGVAVVFFSMLVEDVASDEEEPTTIAINGQEQSSITAQGIADGDPVTGLLMGYKNDRALGMAITYLLQEDGDLAAAETIMDSVQVNLPRTSIASEAVPISVDEFYESTQGGGEPTVYQLHLEPEMPVLLVVHTYKSKEPGQNVASVNVYDPQGVFMGQFDAGWTSSNGARPVSDNWVAFYNFGFQKPEAISFTSAEAGDHTIEVAGAFDSMGLPHRLGALDMRPNAAMVVDIVAQELEGSEVFDYAVEGLADQPVIAYVRPTGTAADSATLSLALIDEVGEEIEERHNYSTGGEPVFLYWVPRNDGQYTIRLTEVNGQASPYELAVLRDETIGRAQMMQTVAAYAEQYNVDLIVHENGDLAISEKIILDIFDDEITNLQRSLPLTDDTKIAEVTVSVDGRPYEESTSGEAGTFQIIEEDGRPAIQWFFADDSADPREFLIDFVVKNAIRNDDIETYNWETRAGSILNWQAIPPDRDFAVAHAEVRVRMPQDVELHNVIAYGATGEATAPIDGPNFQPAVSDELTFTLFRDLVPETAMEIEVVFTQPEEGISFRPGPSASASTEDQQSKPEGESGTSSVELLPNWEVGETRKLEITAERIDYEDGTTLSEVSARTPVDLRVDGLSEDGYVLLWTNGKTEIGDTSIAVDPALEALTNLGNDMTVEYEVDNQGVLIDVRNWEEIAELMQESLDIMIGLFEDSGMSQAELAQIREFIEPMFSTKEQIEALSTEQLQLYHLVYGWGMLELSSPISYDVLLPNPFGGDPFPGIMQLELANMNPDTGQAVVNWTQTLDPNASRQILMETFTNMASAMGSNPPTENDLPEPFSIEDRAEIYIDVDSGWLQTVEHTRKIVIGPTAREDITRIVDVSD